MRASFRLVSVVGFVCGVGCSSSEADVDAAGAAAGVGPNGTGAGNTTQVGNGSVATNAGTTTSAPPVDPTGGLGPADVDGGPLSHGGTITFERIGAPGWYPSRRDPEVGPCDAYENETCCLAQKTVAGDGLTPWDEDLVMTLRGPLLVEQLAVYQPGAAAAWNLVSAWQKSKASAPLGISFDGNGTETAGFDGTIGTECLVDVATADPFPCGPGSDPYCPASNDDAHRGWSGSKLIVMLAHAPHANEVSARCSDDDTGNWFDAPWIGLSLGELVRAGKFQSCHCYAKNPDEWFLGDGCGQFNVFETVNDNNQFANFDVFSTNFFGYAGYVGEGPCGTACDASTFGDATDLVDKSTSTEAAQGAVASPDAGPGAAFRRPIAGYRYFVMLLDVTTRTVQLGLVHPDAIPDAIGALLPSLPAQLEPTTIDAVRALRLPQ